MNGPYDQDPPWSEGPPDKPETCAACGAERHYYDEPDCGGCGFRWDEIEAAVRCVQKVAKALGASADDPEKFRAAVDAALGEMVDPMLTDDEKGCPR